MKQSQQQVKQGKELEIGLLISLLVVFSLILLILCINLYQGGIWVFQGLNGEKGAPGADGVDGIDGAPGVDGINGENGKNAYELAVQDGYQGSMHDWLVSLAIPGADGKDGTSISDVKVDGNGNLIVSLSNGTKLNAGYVGNSGFASETVDFMGFVEVYEAVLMNNEASQLNLRQQPDLNSASLAVISTGTEVLRIGYNRTTGWTRLVYNGVVCYANAKYFDLKYVYKGEIPEIHLPSKITLTVGKEAWFMTNAILADAGEEFSLSFSYSGAGVRVYDGSDAFSITPEVVGEAVLTVKLEKRDEGEWRVLKEQTVAVTVVEERKDLALTGIVLGDSRISDGTIVTKLHTDMKNLTLLGTRKTANNGILHEGRGAWSTAHYLKYPSLTLAGASPVLNSFYNPDTKLFDFSYYMSQNYPNTKLDFVVINLGANDGFTQGSVENLLQLTKSISEYSKATGDAIAILVMTEYLSPDSGYFLSQSNNLDIAAMRGKQFRYFTYLEQAFANREDENIYLLPNYLCINDWSDRYRTVVSTSSGEKEMITDVIHLGRNGYLKEAAMIEAYLFDIFN